MKKTGAILGIMLVLLGTYLVYASSETKGKAGTYGPTPGTSEEKEYSPAKLTMHVWGGWGKR